MATKLEEFPEDPFDIDNEAILRIRRDLGADAKTATVEQTADGWMIKARNKDIPVKRRLRGPDVAEIGKKP